MTHNLFLENDVQSNNKTKQHRISALAATVQELLFFARAILCICKSHSMHRETCTLNMKIKEKVKH